MSGSRSPAGAWLLGTEDRQRMRVSQSLLGLPALLMIQALLALRWARGLLDGGTLACFTGLTLAGCAAFVALLRFGLAERLSREPSLSAPQMVYAMLCVAWGYALAGPWRATVLCLLPVILCFGLFSLKPPAARALALFGIGLMAAVMATLSWHAPADFPPLEQAAHAAFAAVSLALVQALSLRLGRIRARLNAQRAELAEALERISLLATRDPLTGLLNRRAAQEEVRRAVAQAQREGQPLVVALADLDHFKQVNDRHGHHAGDRVLQLFARVAERELRGADRIARWGGEEFLLVLPHTDEAAGCAALERLRRVYGSETLDGLAALGPLGFSAGVALCTGPDDIDAAIERADRAMYSAKVAGRGRTHGSQALEAESV